MGAIPAELMDFAQERTAQDGGWPAGPFAQKPLTSIFMSKFRLEKCKFPSPRCKANGWSLNSRTVLGSSTSVVMLVMRLSSEHASLGLCLDEQMIAESVHLRRSCAQFSLPQWSILSLEGGCDRLQRSSALSLTGSIGKVVGHGRQAVLWRWNRKPSQSEESDKCMLVELLAHG